MRKPMQEEDEEKDLFEELWQLQVMSMRISGRGNLAAKVKSYSSELFAGQIAKSYTP
jgi:hypothetical protein